MPFSSESPCADVRPSVRDDLRSVAPQAQRAESMKEHVSPGTNTYYYFSYFEKGSVFCDRTGTTETYSQRLETMHAIRNASRVTDAQLHCTSGLAIVRSCCLARVTMPLSSASPRVGNSSSFWNNLRSIVLRAPNRCPRTIVRDVHAFVLHQS